MGLFRFQKYYTPAADSLWEDDFRSQIESVTILVPDASQLETVRAAYRKQWNLAWLEPLGFTLGSPREAAIRGSHVSLRHPDAWPICKALIERANVVPDFRGPDAIRLGVAPLYTSHADVWDALDRLRGLVERGEHRLVDAAPGRVT